MSAKNIKLTISYKGNNYHGWQKQINMFTIQGEIEDAFFDLFNEQINIKGSGRTDAGVHAVKQTANFITEIQINPNSIALALNSKLPKDIRIRESELVENGFHSRFDVIGKTYMFNILNSKISNPFFEDYCYIVPFKLDIDSMIRASEVFIGEHDFCGFMSSGSSVKDTTRTIYDIKIQNSNNLITIFITANGFLYNMVRIIAGTLIDIGRGKIKFQDLDYIIKSKERNKAGHTAKAEGLFLLDVYYKIDDMQTFINKKTIDTLGTLL